MKRLIVIGVILLFVGVAFLPSVNVNACKASLEDKFINYEEIQHTLIDSFSNILTNETFIQIMRSPEIQSILTSETTVRFYKSTAAQKILNRQEFKDLFNSDAFQKFQTSLSLSTDTPTEEQIILFIIIWFIVGIVLWIPAAIILWIIVFPMGTMWSIVFFAIANLGSFVIFAPIIWLIVCTLLTIIWPIFSIWLVYMVLEFYGLFPHIPWLPW